MPNMTDFHPYPATQTNLTAPDLCDPATPTNLTAPPPTPALVFDPVNVPLTSSQKLKLANLHRKMLGKRLDAEQATREAQNLEALLQRELAGIATLNNIDFTQNMLSEDFDIVPVPKK